MKSLTYMFVFLFAGMFLASCDVAPAKPSTTTIPGGTVAHVHMEDAEFEPAPLTIAAGTTVIWTNKDPFEHNVRNTDSASFSSPNFTENQTFSRTFATTGTFNYECTNHLGMTGTITVTN